MCDLSNLKMNDVSTDSRLEEWMDTMTIYMPADKLRRLSCSEKMNAILPTLISRVCPKESVKKAKHMLLYKMLTSEQKNNARGFGKELELMKKRNKLKEQLMQKEPEFAEKKKEYTKLLKANENLLQEIQWKDSILSEEKKKLLFLLLNEKALDATSEQYISLRQRFCEVKESENRKMETQSSLHLIKQTVTECQTCIMNSRKRMEEQKENIQNTANEYGFNGEANTVVTESKREMVEYVKTKLEKIPLCTVFEVLVELQQHIMNSMQHLSSQANSDSVLMASKTCVEDGSKLKELNSIFFISNDAEVNGSNKTKSDTHMILLKENCSTPIAQHYKFFGNCQIMEELQMAESCHLDIQKEISETTVACNNSKIHLKTNIAEVTRRLSQIKKFLRRLQTPKTSQKENDLPVPQIDELYSSMQQLCQLGPREIHLFATMPLVSLEKLPLPRGKSVPVYGLLSSYLKVISSTPKYSKSTFSVMKDSSGLTPYYLLLHVWKQLSYLRKLQQAACCMKPFSGTQVNLKVKADVTCEKLKQIQEDFLGILSSFASRSDDIIRLLEILRNHPLNAIIPKDHLVDGQSIQHFIDIFNKTKENDNKFCIITEDCRAEM